MCNDEDGLPAGHPRGDAVHPKRPNPFGAVCQALCAGNGNPLLDGYYLLLARVGYDCHWLAPGNVT